MSDTKNTYYFVIIKFICLMGMFIAFVFTEDITIKKMVLGILLLAIFLFFEIMYEFANSRKPIFLGLAAIILLLMHQSHPDFTVLLLPVLLLDLVTFLHLQFYYLFLVFLGAFFYQGNPFLYCVTAGLCGVIYYQNYYVLEKYKQYMREYEKEEFQLKNSMSKKDTLFKREMERNTLTYENQMLEEKSRIYQNLHDKLGHSINGSLFQLEACKLLIEKEPEQSLVIIEGVITKLRESMDEIRGILRRERPEKKRMALLQLSVLIEECREKYGIDAVIETSGESQRVPERIWDLILDNTFEAVSNALKYAECKQLGITICILHKVVRCTIWDDGKGCNDLKEGMGMQGMKQRVRNANGTIDFDGTNGFVINMILPYEERMDKTDDINNNCR